MQRVDRQQSAGLQAQRGVVKQDRDDMRQRQNAQHAEKYGGPAQRSDAIVGQNTHHRVIQRHLVTRAQDRVDGVGQRRLGAVSGQHLIGPGIGAGEMPCTQHKANPCNAQSHNVVTDARDGPQWGNAGAGRRTRSSPLGWHSSFPLRAVCECSTSRCANTSAAAASFQLRGSARRAPLDSDVGRAPRRLPQPSTTRVSGRGLGSPPCASGRRPNASDRRERAAKSAPLRYKWAWRWGSADENGSRSAD